jgi:hypothetical protein
MSHSVKHHKVNKISKCNLSYSALSSLKYLELYGIMADVRRGFTKDTGFTKGWKTMIHRPNPASHDLVNKVLLEHSHVHLFLCYLRLLLSGSLKVFQPLVGSWLWKNRVGRPQLTALLDQLSGPNSPAALSCSPSLFVNADTVCTLTTLLSGKSNNSLTFLSFLYSLLEECC